MTFCLLDLDGILFFMDGKPELISQTGSFLDDSAAMRHLSHLLHMHANVFKSPSSSRRSVHFVSLQDIISIPLSSLLHFLKGFATFSTLVGGTR